MTLDEEFEKWFEREEFKAGKELNRELAYKSWTQAVFCFSDRMNGIFNKALETETGE